MPYFLGNSQLLQNQMSWFLDAVVKHIILRNALDYSNGEGMVDGNSQLGELEVFSASAGIWEEGIRTAK